MTRRRQSPRKHTRESRQNGGISPNPASFRKIPPPDERRRECTPRILDLAPLVGAILCILAIGLIAAATPSPPREISAFARLERKIARQALAVELAAERLRRKALFPVFE